MGRNRREKVIESLRDKTYRHLLVSASIKRGLAEQIREMRLSRGWTQAKLARECGKVQETISQLENPDYGNYTINTLRRLAEAFDVALIVRFSPFSELVKWMADLTPADLAVPDFEHDPGLKSAAIHMEATLTASLTPALAIDVRTPRRSTNSRAAFVPAEASTAGKTSTYEAANTYVGSV